MKVQRWKAAVLLVPLLILGSLSLLHAYNQRNGVLWRVPIVGYDPRDLLSGHYLQFRYDWNLAGQAEPLQCLEDQCALCAAEPAALNPLVVLQPIAQAAAQCASFIAGTVDEAGNFQINGNADLLSRYYIPESEAVRLDQLLREQPQDSMQFVMGLRVNSAGQAFVDTLYVDGVPLADWLQSH